MIAECLILIFTIVVCIALLLVFSKRNRSMTTVVPLKGGEVTDAQVGEYYRIVRAEANHIRTSNNLPGNVVQTLSRIATNGDDYCVLLEKVYNIQIPEGSDDFRPIALIPLFRKLNGDWINDFVKNNDYITTMATITQGILSSWRLSKYFNAVAPHVLKMDTICRLYIANSPANVVDAIDDQDIIERLSVFHDILLNPRPLAHWVNGYIYDTVKILRQRCFRTPFICPSEPSVIVDTLSSGIPKVDSIGIVRERFEQVYGELSGAFDTAIDKYPDGFGRSILRNLLIASDALDVLTEEKETFKESVKRELSIGNFPDKACAAHGSAINVLLNTDLGLSAIVSCMREMTLLYQPEDIIRGVTHALFSRRHRGDVLYHTMRIMNYLTKTREDDSILTILNVVNTVCRDVLVIGREAFSETDFARLIAFLLVSVNMNIDWEDMVGDIVREFEEDIEREGWGGRTITVRGDLSILLEKISVNEKEFLSNCAKYSLDKENVLNIMRIMKIGANEGIEMDQFVGYISDTLNTADGWRTMSFTFMLRLIIKIAINPAYGELCVMMNKAYKLANRVISNRSIAGVAFFDYKSMVDSFTAPSPCGFDENDLGTNAALDFTHRIRETYGAIDGSGNALIGEGAIDAAIFQSLIDSYGLKANLLLSGIYTAGDIAFKAVTALSSILGYYLMILHLNGDSETRSGVIEDVKHITGQPLCGMLLINAERGYSSYDIDNLLKNIYLLGLDTTENTDRHHKVEDTADLVFSEHLRQVRSERRAEELKRSGGLEYKGSLYD